MNKVTVRSYSPSGVQNVETFSGHAVVVSVRRKKTVTVRVHDVSGAVLSVHVRTGVASTDWFPDSDLKGVA